MALLVRLFTTLLLLAGGIVFVVQSIENRQLQSELNQLEAELGRMPIKDEDRVHIVEIASPDIPPEVAVHLRRVWQFRCNLPAGHSVQRFTGNGRITKDGLYLFGSCGGNCGSMARSST